MHQPLQGARRQTEDEREEAECSCGAGHGSLEGHTGWCDFVSPPEPHMEPKNGD